MTAWTWKTLLPLAVSVKTGQEADPGDVRTSYEKDHDKIVFSPAFRRLQRKAQVFPLPANDFVHTRLTHSLETGCVGRSIGRAVYPHLEKALGKDAAATAHDVSMVLSAACLSHDIGNPPFGHSGEEAIRRYFRSSAGSAWLGKLGKQEQADFYNFDANALGFRELTRIRVSQDCRAVYCKYPSRSPLDPNHKKPKFGYLQASRDAMRDVAEATRLHQTAHGDWRRHPLAYLTEAVDDLCYQVLDLEDGIRQGIVDRHEGERLLRELSSESLYVSDLERIRGGAIGGMVSRIVGAFSARMKEILGGADLSLLEASVEADPKVSKAWAEIKKTNITRCYRHLPVIEVEAAGFKVIEGLLELFLEAVFTPEDAYSKRLIAMMDVSVPGPDGNDYDRVLGVLEFVAGMTDAYALRIYRTLTGQALPESTPFAAAAHEAA